MLHLTDPCNTVKPEN